MSWRRLSPAHSLIQHISHLHYMKFIEMQCETEPPEIVRYMVADNPVVIFSASTCYLCIAVKLLFRGMGVNTTVFEIDEESAGNELEKALSSAVPVVFVGGKLLGSVDKVMASHISGKLVPLLKQAGALWL
uniref:Glutaredoxin n=1 Tax=Chaenorhinum origanifolium TaxID=237460 RepID=A0A6H2RWW5_9LAMI